MLKTHLQVLEWRIQKGELGNLQVETSEKSFEKVPVKWTGSISDLVEFAYAALESRSFNNGEIDVKILIHQLCECFNFKVKDCYNTYREIRKRKIDRTIYLDELKNKLLERMDKADNGVYKKRR